MESKKVCTGIVVLNYNDWETTTQFVRSIEEYKSLDHIIVVDNHSADDSYANLEELRSGKTDVIRTGINGGYGYGNNIGIEYLKQKYKCDVVFISNPDVIIGNEVIDKCINALQNDNHIGIIAPMMKNVDLSINYKCAWKVPSYLEYLLFPFGIFKPITQRIYYDISTFTNNMIPVGCVAGSFFGLSKKVYEKEKVFDDNIFLYCEETLLGIKIKNLDLRSVLLTHDYFIHNHSKTINKSIRKHKQIDIMLQSREYVLCNYYSSNFARRIINKATRRIAMIENEIKCIFIQGGGVIEQYNYSLPSFLFFRNQLSFKKEKYRYYPLAYSDLGRKAA